MKKILILSLLIAMMSFMTINQINRQKEISYTDNLAFEITIYEPNVKILQITDLHLLMGFGHQDRRTFALIKALINQQPYDLIVFTGDLTMSPFAPSLIRYLVHFMEQFETPWTFVFGNHESDLNSYRSILNHLPESNYLYYKVGPNIEDGGYGNFKISFIYQDQPFYHTYFLDSKAEKKNENKADGRYDYLSTAQVSWYESHVSNDSVPSIVFMHTPLRQYMNPIDYIGVFNEKKVYAQGKDTGFFEAMKRHGLSQAVFVGHDHLNDFYFILDDIILAYGRVTGFNAYGNLERGGRMIHIDEHYLLTTEIILESEVIT